MQSQPLEEFTVRLEFIKNDTSLSSDFKECEEEKHKIFLTPGCQIVNLSQIMYMLDKETQQKMEGKIISYYHQCYKSFVFLGCTLENPRFTMNGRKPFNPDHIPGCVNALGPNKDINIENMLGVVFKDG